MSSNEEKIRFVFDMFDINDDGVLKLSDLETLLKHVYDAKPKEPATVAIVDDIEKEKLPALAIADSS